MDKTFKWTIPCNPKDWTTYVEKCEAEVERLSTEYGSYHMAIEQAMDIYISDNADPDDAARLMYDALGMVYTEDDSVSGRHDD